MKCITFGLQTLLQKCVPEVDLAPLAGSQKGKLRLGPEQLLTAIHAMVLAEWALAMAQGLRPTGAAWRCWRQTAVVPRHQHFAHGGGAKRVAQVLRTGGGLGGYPSRIGLGTGFQPADA